jgi:hypothetical protein
MDTALVLERETGHWNYFMSCQTFQVLFVAGGRGEEPSYHPFIVFWIITVTTPRRRTCDIF